ncbi:hypothetical protein ACIREM_21165 [Streptomyces shenzhenensis]
MRVTLGGIAAGRGFSWRQLYVADQAVIGADPDLFVPGQRLTP